MCVLYSIITTSSSIATGLTPNVVVWRSITARSHQVQTGTADFLEPSLTRRNSLMCADKEQFLGETRRKFGRTSQGCMYVVLTY